MAIEFNPNVLELLSYPVSTIGSTIVEPVENIFKIKALKWLENAVLKLDFEKKQCFIREPFY